MAVRRVYFDKFARENFKKDPLLAKNWYDIVKHPIVNREVYFYFFPFGFCVD